jgi:hypothetical protein
MREEPADLVPFMLESFLRGDAGPARLREKAGKEEGSSVADETSLSRPFLLRSKAADDEVRELRAAASVGAAGWAARVSPARKRRAMPSLECYEIGANILLIRSMAMALAPRYPTSRYEPSPLVDLSARSERERLSPSAIKAFLNIMEKWGVRDEDARALSAACRTARSMR